MTSKLLRASADGERYELFCPVAMPRASGFLWNRKMLVQVNCRGYVVAQHMQPEPSKYSHAPILEKRTFMQPEQPFYPHHPGRFVFVKDEVDGTLFSAPYEPVRSVADRFVFSVGKTDVAWRVTKAGLNVSMSVSLPKDDVVELWTVSVENDSDLLRNISLYPYFTIGYMSWMNQSARYREDLGGILASSVTPYQKVEDYAVIKTLKDCTFLLHGTAPDAYETSRDTFEGEGGLHSPDAIREELLGNGDAIYETPTAALQYRLRLAPRERREFMFLFGPARGDTEVLALRQKYLQGDGFSSASADYRAFAATHKGCLKITTANCDMDNFVNHWLCRQVFYHGCANRLSTDPQTRNFVQDSMGMVYIEPTAARDAFVHALGQQQGDGAMPEGIVLGRGTKLKYINEVPHTDHCVWLPIFLKAYLDETNDFDVLNQSVTSVADNLDSGVFERVTAALRSLLDNRDQRRLSLIAQGDWCDPMNMVGHKGRGVSGWLSMATVYALKLWADICRADGRDEVAKEMLSAATAMSTAIHEYLWDGNWFARGITDDNRTFGVQGDEEGRIYLNSQSWALLAGIATDDQREKMLRAVDEQLDTPFGMMMLAPAYTRMHEDIGRVTQKHPGSGENGSVYNHAAMFYVLALYRLGDADRAFEQLSRMLPGPDESDYTQRGQLPVFVPNYYRGAVHQFPRTAGRSSQLFHTGAASWLYRIVVEELFGLKGTVDGLNVAPQLPSSWSRASVQRRFRGAEFTVSYRRDNDADHARLVVDGKRLDDMTVRGIECGRSYTVEVVLQATSS